jgi:predicted small integral membrane protein
MSAFEWMAWTRPVAIFFIGIAVMLIGMTVWEICSPTVPRRGFLPLVTTRGDRLFVGLLTAAYINLGWTGFTDLSQWYGVILGALATAIIMRWG